jgi:hypothetical protein
LHIVFLERERSKSYQRRLTDTHTRPSSVFIAQLNAAFEMPTHLEKRK